MFNICLQNISLNTDYNFRNKINERKLHFSQLFYIKLLKSVVYVEQFFFLFMKTGKIYQMSNEVMLRGAFISMNYCNFIFFSEI